MDRKDKIKLVFSRNWKLPGRERISRFLRLSDGFNHTFRNGITWLNEEPIAIHATIDSYIESVILSSGTYEAEIEKLISISLTTGDNALDVGANIGLQSLRMSRYVGEDGKILAFEPIQYLQQKFNSNIDLNRVKNVTLLPFALSNYEDIVEFGVDENSWNQGTFSLLETSLGVTNQLITIKIADQLPEISSLNSLALIKIDVEGFEFNVLRGLKNTIQKFRPRIIFEYDENYWTRNEQSIKECYEFLNEFNYRLYQIYPVGCEMINKPEDIKSGNLFCLPEATI